jgi:hypothetical protein
LRSPPQSDKGTRDENKKATPPPAADLKCPGVRLLIQKRWGIKSQFLRNLPLFFPPRADADIASFFSLSRSLKLNESARVNEPRDSIFFGEGAP